MTHQEKQILALARILGELTFLHQQAHLSEAGGDEVRRNEEGTDAQGLAKLAAEYGPVTGEQLDVVVQSLLRSAVDYWFESSGESPLPAAHFEQRWKRITTALEQLQEEPPAEGSLDTWWDNVNDRVSAESPTH